MRGSVKWRKLIKAIEDSRDSILTKKRFHIVGIGASAGGMDAFESFFNTMPENSKVAFILVSHLDPNHNSMLPEIIQRKTKMKVNHVKDNMKVQVNQVYIIPPNKEMTIQNGYLLLKEMSQPHGSNLPIDTFLRSLAKDQTSQAICIILSGTGTDGTLGLRAIKGEAGMAIVQDPESCKFDGMPRSAIASGLSDYVLSPTKMPEQLLNYVKHSTSKSKTDISRVDDTAASDMQKVFSLLRARTGHDFSLYKKNTIHRRIERRMHIHQIDNLSDYVRYVEESKHEAYTLFKELLIGVTNFFRNPTLFDLLKEKYIPQLIDNRPDDYTIRVWVPGCSTGEEAYSIAIIIREYIDSLNRHINVQIFGTDLDEESIKIARTGKYPESITADVSRDRLNKYFIKNEGQYRVKKVIREMVVFASQNVIKDPPFTKLDMLSCRNMLIYFGSELQKKLLPLFHYSLKNNGLLVLGTSESIGQFDNLFMTQETKWKIFKKKSTEISHPMMDFPSQRPTSLFQEKEMPEVPKSSKKIDLSKILQSILSQSETPPCAIIDNSANIFYIHGHTGRYLEPPQGEASINIIEMARPGLKNALTAAINKIVRDRQDIYIKDIQINDNVGNVNLILHVKALSDLNLDSHDLMMVTFEETDASLTSVKKISSPQSKKKIKSDEIKQLENELQYTKVNLQATIEELKSANEELQSTNEELQSTNEELETSKEELQSLNEESSTVNGELQSRIDELSDANDDIKNLLAATKTATIFLDINLCVRRFTPQSTKIVPLTQNDLRRPINHFSTTLKDVNLMKLSSEVLDDLKQKDLESQSSDGLLYRMRIIPYRTTNNIIDGVVITFDDITELKRTTEEDVKNQENKRLAIVVSDSNDAITLQDFVGNILAWNKGATKMYGFTEQEALRMNICEMMPPELEKDALDIILKLKTEDITSFKSQRVTKDGKTLDIWLTASKIFNEDGELQYISTTERDLKDLKNLE